MERGALVVQRLAPLAVALLAGTESTEIFHSLGHYIAIKAHNDAARRLAIDLNIEKHLSTPQDTDS